ncbi:MAG TPA: TIGR03936 family radical SAM-associated protein [Gemmataceae bacterium]|nr:TIGR03936 family radical SAM-associated protein [Gemmataceae bacterium]
MTGDKFRFRFSKTGTLRLLSHHDLMRCLERMLRRAAVPFKSTAGFHPAPRVVFSLSLPLGVVGRDEVVEIELLEPRDSDELLAQLNAQAPAGLTFTRATAVPMKATALPRRVVYALPLPPERVADTEQAAARLMAEEKVWMNRIHPQPKRINIRPFFRRVAVADGVLEIDLWVTGTGSAKAEEVIRLLGVADVQAAGAVLERAAMEIYDEVPNPDPADMPPSGPAEVLPLDPAIAAAMKRDEDLNQPAGADWGASPSGPVVE